MNREVYTRLAMGLCLVLFALAAGVLGFLWRRQQPTPTVPHLTVVFPNLTNSNCTLIQTPEGRTILIGAGSAADMPNIVKLLHSRNVQGIDLLILPSPKDDTIGGVPILLESAIPVHLVWDNALTASGDVRRKAFASIRSHAVPVRIVHSGATIEIGSMPTRLSILWPPEHGPHAQSDPMLCRLDYGNAEILFAGASTGDAEQNLVSEQGRKLTSLDQYTILQVADHGADTTTSLEMLRLSTPAVAVISCSAEQPPALGTLHRLQAAGAAVWRTDTQGAITVTADGSSTPVVIAEHL